MGVRCTCISEISKEEGSVKLDLSNRQALNESLEIEEKTVDVRDLIRLQGVIRGFMDRKKTKTIYNSNRNTRIRMSKKPPNPLLGSVTSMQTIAKVPDYSSLIVKKMQRKLGNYEFCSVNDGCSRVSRGPVLLSNQAVYIGEWNSNEQRDGFGMQIWPDSTVYEGTWKNDMPLKGRLIYEHGDVYDGEYLDNQACGKGTFYSVNDSIYSGQWLRDRRHGLGHESSSDGVIYKGEFYEDLKNGRGQIAFSDTSEYEGDFFDDHIHGIGKFIWADGREYLGEFNYGKMHGKGTFMWPDGRKYEGEYLNDQKHGYGRFITSTNNLYEGNWKFGKKHGEGIQISDNGISKKGEWVEGKRIRWIE